MKTAPSIPGCLFAVFFIAACGEKGGAEFLFSVSSSLECPTVIAGASLHIEELGVCVLDVSPNGTASGFCGGIPGGRSYELRLEYWALYEGVRIIVAVYTKSVDFSNESDEVVKVDFSDVAPIYPDDDNDQRENLRELCLGTDPTMG